MISSKNELKIRLNKEGRDHDGKRFRQAIQELNRKDLIAKADVCLMTKGDPIELARDILDAYYISN